MSLAADTAIVVAAPPSDAGSEDVLVLSSPSVPSSSTGTSAAAAPLPARSAPMGRNSDAEDWEHESRAAAAYDKSVNKKPIIRTVLAALILFTVGSLMLYYGWQVYPAEKDRGLAMMIVGSIAFIPGSYASWILLGAWRGWEGYHFDQLPSYDD